MCPVVDTMAGASGSARVAEGRLAGRGRSCLLLAAVALACSLQLAAPFGDSKDGVNAGTWGLASRAVREQGLAASHWGAKAEGRWPGPDVYVNHPPLIIATATISEAVLGEHPWSSRLPSLLATCAAAVLLLHVLRELGHGQAIALAAAALALGVPMVRTYGAMLDTPMLGLPFALGLTLVWLRSRNGQPSSSLAWVTVGVGAGISSWLGWPLAAGVVVALTARRERRAAVALGSGVLVASGLVLLWVVQSGAGVHALVDLVSARTDAPAAVSFGEGMRANLRSAYPVWTLLLMIPAAILALRRRASRPVVVVWWLVVVLWCLAFRERAATHEYWTWWALVPLAVGWAVLLEATSTRFPAAAVRRWLPAVGVGLATFGALLPSVGWTRFERGLDAARLLTSARYPADQRRAWVLSASPDPLPWVSYDTGLPMEPLLPKELGRLAATAPDDLVLAAVTSGPPAEAQASTACLQPVFVRGAYALAPAAALARALDAGCSVSP
jgi:4-amino-4-deoxy-L-arabinose transferase-like glycosyltransferase